MRSGLSGRPKSKYWNDFYLPVKVDFTKPLNSTFQTQKRQDYFLSALIFASNHLRHAKTPSSRLFSGQKSWNFGPF